MAMITFDGVAIRQDTITAPSLEAIALGLARIPRFTGQTKTWFPVLAHCFLVAELVPNEHRLDALLHDAAEAITGDIPKHWKTEEEKLRERVLMERIYFSLDLDYEAINQDEIHKADTLALRAEAHWLMPDGIFREEVMGQEYALPRINREDVWEAQALGEASHWIGLSRIPSMWINMKADFQCEWVSAVRQLMECRVTSGKAV